MEIDRKQLILILVCHYFTDFFEYGSCQGPKAPIFKLPLHNYISQWRRKVKHTLMKIMCTFLRVIMEGKGPHAKKSFSFVGLKKMRECLVIF
jgi:hypothetical protein